MKLFCRIISTLAFSLFTLLTCAQKSENLTPRIVIPTSKGLFKYVDYPVGNFTGVPHINVPLHLLNFSGLDFPISISYHASGHKVNDIASWVGLGWSLQAGGAITRSVIGAPDDDAANGIFRNPIKTDADIARLGEEEGHTYLNDIVNRKTDSEPDVFYYNFLGMSGKFSFDSQGNIMSQPHSDFKIEFINSLFKITDDLGRQFHFDNTAKTFSYNNGGGPFYAPITSWNLTKIVTANKKDTINLEYSAGLSQTIRTVDYSMQVGRLAQIINSHQGRTSDAGEENIPVASSHFEQPGYSFLSKITFSQGSIEFISSTGRLDYGFRKLDSIIIRNNNEILKKVVFEKEYFFSEAGYNFYALPQDKNRLKLTGVKILRGIDDEVMENYGFQYEEAYKLPPRNNCGVDWWGYSNGKINNRTLIPKPPTGQNYEFTGPEGIKATTNIASEFADRSPDENHMKAYLLKRITYPSKGYTDFEFEPNKRSRTTNVSRQVTLAYAIGTKENTAPTIVEFTPTSNVSATLSMNIPLWDDFNKPFIEIRNLTNSSDGFWRFTTYPGEQSFRSQNISFKAGNRYQVTASISPNPNNPEDDTDKRVIANIFHQAMVSEVVSEIGPGLRIKKISSFTATNVPARIDEYRYGKNESGFGESRFFDYIFDMKSYVQDYHFSYIMGWPTSSQFRTQALIVLSRPVFDHYAEGNLLAYPFVTKYTREVAGDRDQKTSYEYSFFKDEQYGQGFPEAVSLVSSFWKNGHLLKETMFLKNSSGTYDTLRVVENNYDEIKLRSYYGLRVRQNFIMRGTGWSQQTNDHLFRYFNYSIDSGIKRLISNREKMYEGGLLKSTKLTTLSYLANSNLQPRLTSSEQSSGVTETSYFTFPQDYLAGNTVLDRMLEGNLLKYPIEQIIFNGSEPTAHIFSGNLNLYDGNSLGMVDKQYELALNNPVAITQFKISNRGAGQLPSQQTKSTLNMDSRYRLVNTLLLKDSYGNPREIKNKDRSGMVFLWGYRGQYPIAKIENATYAEVRTVLTQAVIDNLNVASLPEADMETLITNVGKSLRADLRLSKAQVSTYTYKPLVGMTSMTDPRGITEFYQYDGFQRLKDVLDFDNNVLQDYRYHYRP